ncbi:MAG TPA: inner membrane CreD family protein, partial [Puia sp.]|nr:inner membrane CreD family protein [Puia sp.]
MEINTTGTWKNFRTLFKSGLVGALILLLLIPTAFIQNLVSERQDRQRQAVAEIGSRWAGSQTVTGPVIGVPYFDSVPAAGGYTRTKRWAYFLPDKLDIHSTIVPEKRYRGIYEVIVYTTQLDIRGGFDGLHLEELGLGAPNMLWKEAQVFFNISDLQGLNEDVVLHLATKGGAAAPGADSSELRLAAGKVTTEQWSNALTAPLPGWAAGLAAGGDQGQPLEFSTQVRMKGSGDLLFVPVGKETKVSATSSWPSPSFTGSALPDVRTVQNNGFVADWRVIALHRKFPQQ